MDYRSFFIPLAGLLFVLFNSCQKEKTERRDYPQLRTAAVDNITAEGVRFNAMIISGSTESVTEYGFVWGITAILNIMHSEKVVMEETPVKDKFYIDVTFALQPMKDYYARAYVKVGDLVIYGDPVKFLSLGSLAPVINNFEPKSATWGDTITIYGKNFSFQGLTNKVYFSDVYGKVIESKNEWIKVIVPNDLINNKSLISVEVFGNRCSASVEFDLFSPVKIFSHSPSLVSWLDTLTLSGLFPMDLIIDVAINTITCTIASRNANEIQVIVPGDLLFYDLKVALKFNNHTLTYDTPVKLRLPFVQNNNNLTGNPGDLVTLFGLFSPVSAYNKIRFSGISQDAQITLCTKSKLQFVLPDYVNKFQTTFDLTSGSILVLDDQSFSYELPTISDISPESGNQFTEITIYGSHFVPGNTKVFLDYFQLNISQMSENEIKATFPDYIPNGAYLIRAEVLDQVVNSGNSFEVKKPEIVDFYPKEATYNDTITILVENFTGEKWVSLNSGDNPPIVSQTESEIKVKLVNCIPFTFNTIQVGTDNYVIQAHDYLILKQPVIGQYPELSGKRNQNLVIASQYTSTNSNCYTVQIGDYYASVENITPTSFEIKVPDIPDGIYTISLTIAEYQYNITTNFMLSGDWLGYLYIPGSISASGPPGTLLSGSLAGYNCPDKNKMYSFNSEFIF